MKRDAQATRQRIFEAATAEFAQYGIAGARIDRIAAASGSNKAMIYAYYGSKDGLFEAVATEWITRHLQAVPLDVHDLPEYAGRLFDQHRAHPEMRRLLTWADLELDARTVRIDAVVETYHAKVAAIARAQQAGEISDRFPAVMLLELLLALVNTKADFRMEELDPAEPARRRQAIKDAVGLLVRVEAPAGSSTKSPKKPAPSV